MPSYAIPGNLKKEYELSRRHNHHRRPFILLSAYRQMKKAA